MKYKRINELGLIIYRLYNNGECKYVRASDLEALLKKGVEVYGADMHTALLINIQPIEKPNPISIKELISDLKILQIDGLAERIEKWGIEQSGVSDE